MAGKLRAFLYRAFQIALLALLAYGLAHTLPFDLAFLFAGDLLVYLEIVTAVWLAAQVTRLRTAIAYARSALRGRRRSFRRLKRRVSRRARRVRRPTALDDDRPWGALVPA
jgi:hypothetical protein